MSVCTYDFVMSDQNFILTFLVLALRVIARFSYDVVNRWNERWLGNITSATDHELWRCKGKKNVLFPIAFPSGSGRRALILHFPFFFDDWFRIPNFCHLYPKYRFCLPSQNFGESLFPASCQFPYPVNFVCSRILRSILVNSRIPKILFQTLSLQKKWVAQSQNHTAWYQKFSSVKKRCLKTKDSCQFSFLFSKNKGVCLR